MVTTLKEFSNVENFLILDSLKKQKNDLAEGWSEVITLDPPVGRSVVGSGRNCRRALKIIQDICAKYNKVSLFRANLEWPLNNALIGLEHSSEIANITLCNYPEGVGSLLYVYPSSKQLLKTRIKHILGFVGGAPFYSYKGDIMGLNRSEKIYSLMPSAIRNEQVQDIIQIPVFKQIETNVKNDSCVFIGQNYDNYMSRGEYAKISAKAALYAKSLGYKKLFYKPHHYDISGIELEIFRGNNFSVINDNRTIEEIFFTEQYSCVVSYTSSALVNLKLMLSDSVRCISCFSNLIFKLIKIDGKQYRHLFEISGVELYE